MTLSLSRGALIAAAGAAVLFFAMILSWYGIDFASEGEFAEFTGGDDTLNAWQTFRVIDVLLFLTVTATAVWVGAAATGSAFARRLQLGALAGGGLCALLVLYRIISPPEDLSVESGAYVALLACVAIAYGAATARDGAALANRAPDAPPDAAR